MIYESKRVYNISKKATEAAAADVQPVPDESSGTRGSCTGRTGGTDFPAWHGRRPRRPKGSGPDISSVSMCVYPDSLHCWVPNSHFDLVFVEPLMLYLMKRLLLMQV